MSYTKMAQHIELSSQQIDELLNPFYNRDDIVKKWKETLQEMKKPTTTKGMEWLAQTLRSEYKVPPKAISALFNRRYVDPVLDPNYGKTPNIRIAFTPMSFAGTEDFKYSDEEFVSSIRKRLEYPELPIDVNKIYLGPTNSDLDSDLKKSRWCHEDLKDIESSDPESSDPLQELDDNSIGFHHGMLKCQCRQEIPDKGFMCEGCRSFINWKSIGSDWFETDIIRFPILDGKIGGWGGFFCSRRCLLEFPSEEITEMHDVIIEAIDSMIENDDE